jgi:hypothetical protein
MKLSRIIYLLDQEEEPPTPPYVYVTNYISGGHHEGGYYCCSYCHHVFSDIASKREHIQRIHYAQRAQA